MKPFNDKMPTKDSTAVQKLNDLDKSTDFSKISSENIEKNYLIKNNSIGENVKNNHKQENEKNVLKTNKAVNIEENVDKSLDKSNTKSNKTISENKLKENDEEYSIQTKDSRQQSDTRLNENDLVSNENIINNKETCVGLEHGSEEDETSCSAEDVEDVEIPEEEDIDEIIVPDEAEAEDLTDEKYNDGSNGDVIEKTLNKNVDVDDEDDISKDSVLDENVIETSLHEEETTKSSDAVEKDDDSDKKSLNNDIQETHTKDSEEGDNENVSIGPEIVDLEEDTRDEERCLEELKSNEPALNEEDTTSQKIYDPLNCNENKEHNDKDINDDVVKNDKNECSLARNENDEEEDDEVQFIETRNSPIFIESDDDDDDDDDEDNNENSKDKVETTTTINTNNNNNTENNNKNDNCKQIITTSTTIVTVPKCLIVTRTSARKSTAKPQQNQQQQVPINNNSSMSTASHIQNKTKNFQNTINNVQNIVDCIELLDSSDEESSTSRNKPTTQQQKTPQKRTLLAAKGNYYKNNNNINNNKCENAGINFLPNNYPSFVRQQPKKPTPPPLPPPTPQSNFLNAVQLQPAALVSGSNPPAFSALLSNKSVIIPNAFYGNPPRIKLSPDIEIERRYARWLENFINQFCKPQFVATHSCLVFLQRALKYKDFVRIKALRSNLNNNGQSSNNQITNQLITELRTIFLKNTKKITYFGRRFCELTCSAMPGKAVALMAHGISGKVTLKTCNMELPTPTTNTVASTITATTTTTSSSSCSNTSSTNTLTRKRQLEDDEDEYTPDKSKVKTKGKSSSENGDEDSGEIGDDRKRSLRTKRTKRLDNSFSYNEDDLLAEYEIDDEDDEKLIQVEIERKIEEKRLEAQKQRQQQVKSFESAFIQAFAKTIGGPTTSSKTKKHESLQQQRVRLQNTTTATATSIKQYTANNDAEDLLQATWIENVENDETHIISDDDEPKEHRIYKQQQKIQQVQQQYNVKPSGVKFGSQSSKTNHDEIITGDDDYNENNCHTDNPSNIDPIYWPKNVDSQMYVNGKLRDKCVICNLSCQRLVHHYVNEHRGCEVYNSRLSLSQIKLLKQGNCTIANVSQYKNGQFQYEAFCIFCQKMSRFMFPYWYQHFTMHTGEYAYRCIGCGIRKPTRSLLTQHQTQGCPDVGGVVQDYAHHSKTLQIEAKICNLCNYVQLHRSNIVKHLHTQHYIKQILPKHIQTIVLLKTPATLSTIPTSSSSPLTSFSSASGHAKRTNNRSSSSYPSSTYIINDDDDDDNDFAAEEIIPDERQQQMQTHGENNYYNYIPPYMQAAINSGNFSFENVDAGDDLSFMICGMLDVQINPEAD